MPSEDQIVLERRERLEVHRIGGQALLDRLPLSARQIVEQVTGQRLFSLYVGHVAVVPYMAQVVFSFHPPAHHGGAERSLPPDAPRSSAGCDGRSPAVYPP